MFNIYAAFIQMEMAIINMVASIFNMNDSII
jgi:hypothetical protein